jgi:hypothetical protein
MFVVMPDSMEILFISVGGGHVFSQFVHGFLSQHVMLIYSSRTTDWKEGRKFSRCAIFTIAERVHPSDIFC